MFYDYSKIFDLQKKVTVITGGTGILGQEFCKGFAAFGATVVIVDLAEEKINALIKYLEKTYSISAFGIVCDVSSPKQVKAMTNTIVKKYGRIDILLNNAATKLANLDQFFADFENYDLEAWRKIMSVNLDGMFLVAQAVGNQMVKQQKGCIIQTASIYGQMAADQRIYEGSYYLDRQINTPAAYSTSKAGVIGLTKHLAALWGEKGVRVNALSPGGVESGQNTTFKQKYAQRVPMLRMARKEEMVGPAIFLASDAASYITGQNILIDGGLSVW